MLDYKDMARDNKGVDVLSNIIRQDDVDIYLKEKLFELTEDPVKNVRFYRYTWAEVSSE